jgi:glycosyltransferase involved in cell wall biosynthesis
MKTGAAIGSAALLICTFRRPQTFVKLIQSVAGLEIPEGLAFSIVIADNNPEGAWDSYIGPAVSALPWPVHYGHEPVTGYSSARNKAIEIALQTDAEAFLFVDDDMILERSWLREHLRSLQELGADIVNGRIYGVRERFPHDTRLEKCGAGNVSFRRRIIDPEGLGLRFDPAFNKLGMEDQAFFREASRRGAIIKQSDLPLIYNYYGREDVPEEEIINKMHTTGSMQHNLVALARREKGLLPATALASKGLLFAVKGVGLQVLSTIQTITRQGQRAHKSALSSRKEFLKMKGRFTGLSGQIVSRQDVRRSDPSASS